MKGQFNIEFIASVFIFGIIITYTLFFIYDMLPSFSLESESERIRSKSYQISDLLIGDPGLNNTGGTDWNKDNVQRVGLSLEDEPYVLDWNKILQLNETDYTKIKNGFYSDYQLKIIIENASTSNQILVDKGSLTAVGQTMTIVRVAPVLINDNYEKLRIILSVWKV